MRQRLRQESNVAQAEAFVANAEAAATRCWISVAKLPAAAREADDQQGARGCGADDAATGALRGKEGVAWGVGGGGDDDNDDDDEGDSFDHQPPRLQRHS